MYVWFLRPSHGAFSLKGAEGRREFSDYLNVYGMATVEGILPTFLYSFLLSTLYYHFIRTDLF